MNGSPAKLTAGSVRAMFEGRPMEGPYLQFLQLKVYEKPNGGGVHYKYPIDSDNYHTLFVYLCVVCLELWSRTANISFKAR